MINRIHQTIKSLSKRLKILVKKQTKLLTWLIIKKPMENAVEESKRTIERLKKESMIKAAHDSGIKVTTSIDGLQTIIDEQTMKYKTRGIVTFTQRSPDSDNLRVKIENDREEILILLDKPDHEQRDRINRAKADKIEVGIRDNYIQAYFGKRRVILGRIIDIRARSKFQLLLDEL